MSGGKAGRSSSNKSAAAASSSSSTSTCRVSLPKSVKEMIQTIKEIAGGYSDDEIHAMLKECSMDPNEAAQKLLSQDPFHEVRRKRDKKKDKETPTTNINNNKESSDSRWRTGTRPARGNFFNSSSPRYNNTASDSSDGRKENGIRQLPLQDTQTKAFTPISSSSTAVGNVPAPPSLVTKNPSSQLTISSDHPTPTTSDHLTSPVSLLGLYSSASDPVLDPSLEPRPPGGAGAIKRQLGSVTEPNSSIVGDKSTAIQEFANRLPVTKLGSRQVNKPDLSSPFNEKASPEAATSFVHGKMPSKSQSVERNQSSDTSHHSSSSVHGTTSNSRPSSNYGSRSQQHIGSQKAVGPSREWKPKPTNPNSAPASGIVGTSEVGPIIVEAVSQSLPTLSVPISEDSDSKLQHKFDELHLSHNQHVIIPNHLQVPEAERTGLSFGSFDANFGLTRCYNNGPDIHKSTTPLSDSSQDVEVMVEEPYSSNQIEPSTALEGDYVDHRESPKNVPDNLSNIEADVSSSSVHEYDHSKQETTAPVGNPQYSVVHTAPNYNFGFMPPILGTQFAPFDTSEPQSRDTSRIPSFVVPQPFDPSASYYTQYYRPSTDGDGRFSPFLAPGAANKYNGNIAMLSPSQSGQPQESGNSLVHSTAGPTPLATQAAGVVQSSLAVTQQPVPVFRQPSGVHLPHYPPNYVPYSQYFSPFYVPPQTIHHYLTNPAFQQAPAGSVYPPPAAATATGVKFSLSQYKPVTNTGNSTHVGIPSGYAPYSSSPTGYSPSPAASTTNSTGNDELSASQYKENNIYITGQQSEGAAVWIPAQGRDMQPSSFYSLSPQGQHVTFTPTHGGGFAGIYHPTQSMGGAVEMVGPPAAGAGVYQQQPQQQQQQQQRAQMNWTNNY